MRSLLVMVCMGVLGGLAGCVTVVRPPVAHVHIGHAITGWVDTPNREGLAVVAQREAETAAELARLAFQSRRNPGEVKRLAGDALHALDPALQPRGPGTGYGLIRAIDGAIDHVKFAADSGDASKNLGDSIIGLESSASKVRQAAKVSVAIAQEIRRSEKPEDLASLSEEMKAQTEEVVRELRAWRSQLDEVVSRESPSYQTVERRYLFGLVRLPNGLWQWHPDVDKQGSRGVGAAGGRY